MTRFATIAKLAARFERISLRERMLVSGALLAAVWVLWNMLLMQPVTNKQKALLAELNSLQESIGTTAAAMESATALDPTNVAVAQLKTAQAELLAVNKELAVASADLIPPERMSEVIYDVLRHQQALTLISLRNEPRQTLLATVADDAPEKDSKPAEQTIDSTEDAATQAANIAYAAKLANSGPYLHPVELVIEGSYLDILAYTRALEALPWRFYWQRFELQTTAYPLNRVRIELSTLSLDEAWLGV
jgi:MSHA biogenesis protein MshJ